MSDRTIPQLISDLAATMLAICEHPDEAVFSDALAAGYPFAASLDEVAHDVLAWGGEVQAALDSAKAQVRARPVVGQRVALARDVERYPNFIARQGMMGTIVGNDGGMLRVRMDDPLPGAEDWDNEVQWLWADDGEAQVMGDIDLLRDGEG